MCSNLNMPHFGKSGTDIWVRNNGKLFIILSSQWSSILVGTPKEMDAESPKAIFVHRNNKFIFSNF